ncbi:hypothetical protein Tco_0706325 [Tanacetum coccineum]|uniref:Uncharacterized protein n=1 Tax=Tanacetum coccineum TaxID=301880 RepID=A0ABQ4Y724_9ASTR
MLRCLLEAVEKRFGGNTATKKTQRNLLKQQYENFTAPSSEMLHQSFDRLQKLVSQLELLDEKLSQEDVNQKLLRSLSPKWIIHAVVWWNKTELETMSMYDLYNNLKVYELEVKGMSSSSSSTQNMAFVSSSNNSTSSSNEAVNAAHGVTTASTQSYTTFTPTNIDNLSDAVIWSAELQEIQTTRTRKAQKDVPEETSPSIALVSCGVVLECQIVDNCKKGLGYEKYNAVPPPYIGNFMPPTHDLSFTSLDEFVNKPVVENRKSDEEVSKVVRKSDDSPIIEDWVLDSEEENMLKLKLRRKQLSLVSLR